METVERLVSRATERASLDDFGDLSWREGLTILVDSLERHEQVFDAGRTYLYEGYIHALVNRLRVVEYLKQNAEVRDEPVERPLVILGMPRTGMTVVSYLLDQDRRRRSLLNWEAGDSVPPPTSATLRTDPRCVAKKALIDAIALQLETAGPGVAHWEDA